MAEVRKDVLFQVQSIRAQRVVAQFVAPSREPVAGVLFVGFAAGRRQETVAVAPPRIQQFLLDVGLGATRERAAWATGDTDLSAPRTRAWTRFDLVDGALVVEALGTIGRLFRHWHGRELFRAGVGLGGLSPAGATTIQQVGVTWRNRRVGLEFNDGPILITRSSRDPLPAPAASYPPNSPTPVVVPQAVAGTRRLRRVLRDMHAVYSVADQVARTDVQGAGDLAQGGWQDVRVAGLEADDGGPRHAGALGQFRLGQRGPQPQLAQSSESRQSLPSVVSLFEHGVPLMYYRCSTRGEAHALLEVPPARLVRRLLAAVRSLDPLRRGVGLLRALPVARDPARLLQLEMMVAISTKATDRIAS